MKKLLHKTWTEIQSVHYEALYSLGGERIRINVKRDDRAHQCYGRAFAYDTIHCRWHQIAEIPYPNLRCLKTIPNVYKKEVSSHTFSVDENTLLFEVKLIVLDDDDLDMVLKSGGKQYSGRYDSGPDH